MNPQLIRVLIGIGLLVLTELAKNNDDSKKGSDGS